MVRLVLGGERSGKSAYALTRFLAGPAPRTALVTGRAADLSFRRQILAHRLERPPEVSVREVGRDLPAALTEAAGQCASLLVDSLDFWLFGAGGGELARSGGDGQGGLIAELAAGIEAAAGCEITLVSSEIGLGPLPADAGTRRFVRELGALHREVAVRCDEVCLVVAGLPLFLKGGGQAWRSE